MDPMLERRRRLLMLGRDPGMLPGLGGEMPQMGPGMPPGMSPPMGAGMPPPPPPMPGMPPGGAPPTGAGMPMPPFPQGAAPPVPQPQGGPPPGMGMGMGIPTPPGMGSYGAQPAQAAHPAWFPGPPVPKPRPPPRRRTAVEELGERTGQPPAPPAPAHEPEAGRVPQPIGDASGYDPTAVYAGAKGSTREMPRDTSFGHSANLMDWISAKLGWR